MAGVWSSRSSPSRPAFRRATTGRALADGPEFVESDTDYPTLLEQTGWIGLDCLDLTLDYAASHRRLLRADEEQRDALEALIGASEYAERETGWRSKLAAVEAGLLRRELFVARPDRA